MNEELPDHKPVLLASVLDLLNAKPGQTIVDATVGRAGHSLAIAERVLPGGRLIGLDRDPESLGVAERRLTGKPADLFHANFSDIALVLRRAGVEQADGVLADLGVSSPQLDQAERGFSFRLDGPLDMRMDPTRGEPASKLIARLSAEHLARIFWEYGEERYSRRIASRIVAEREREPIVTTGQLARLVRTVVPPSRKSGPSIDPATRVFQSLRIAVNDELGSLQSFLEQLPQVLRPGGVAVVISFHSLEDRPVKHAFRNDPRWESLTRKPVTASPEEVLLNPRSRSAKLRAAVRLNDVAGRPAG